MIETLLAFSLALNQEPKTAIITGTPYVIQASAEAETPIEMAVQPVSTPILAGIECYCVTYARQFAPALPRVRDAGDIPSNTTLADAELVLLDYDGLPHVAVKLRVADGLIEIAEANFRRCETGIRIISTNDPHLRGYWKTP